MSYNSHKSPNVNSNEPYNESNSKETLNSQLLNTTTSADKIQNNHTAEKREIDTITGMFLFVHQSVWRRGREGELVPFAFFNKLFELIRRTCQA
jgi:hypothetical protein